MAEFDREWETNREMKSSNSVAARGQSCTSSVESRSTEMREMSGKVRLSSSWIDVHSHTLSLSPRSPGCFSRVASHFSQAQWRRNSLPLPAVLCLLKSLCSALLWIFKTSLPSVAGPLFIEEAETPAAFDHTKNYYCYLITQGVHSYDGH